MPPLTTSYEDFTSCLGSRSLDRGGQNNVARCRPPEEFGTGLPARSLSPHRLASCTLLVKFEPASSEALALLDLAPSAVSPTAFTMHCRRAEKEGHRFYFH